MKSQIFKSAWEYIRKGVADTMSEALKLAYKRAKIIKRLMEEVCEITYKKVNGEIRTAVATLQGSRVQNNNATIVVYYDIEKDALRSFKIENLTTIK